MDANKNPIDRSQEILDERSVYAPFYLSNFQPLPNTETKTSRYKSPVPATDRLTLSLKRNVLQRLGANLQDFALVNNSHSLIPSYWQDILNYLHEKGGINSPQVFFEPLFNDEPRIFSCSLPAQYEKIATDGQVNSRRYSKGASLDADEAISKTIGEFLERYTLSRHHQKNLIRSSVKSLAKVGKNFLNIFDLAGFSDWQKEMFPRRQFDENSNFFWAGGTELLSGEPTMIPAQLALWDYSRRADTSEPQLRQSNTNGAAGHFTRGEAILAGIYESIQRDAFLIHWLNSIPPPRIDPDTIEDKKLRTLLDQLKRYHLEPIFLNTTCDLAIPSCICVLADNSGLGPKTAVGGGCEPDMAEALMRSITEALGVFRWLRWQEAEFSIAGDYKPFTDPHIDQTKRLLLWKNTDMFSKIKPFISGKAQPFKEAAANLPAFATPKEELAFLMDIFRRLGEGYEIYVYEAKHRFLTKLGYHAVQVVIPALVPLYLNEIDAPLGAKRLKTVPQKLGYKPTDELNPWPHPFP
ncbi:MAG: YcaO-like family protein [Candidatus Sungbacteria bacterium]|uniref:YcaO-like family protein n=1 Tax=Candidatus Sungiibacteriota bacterium TaxID=2750080 RepID=A0A931SDU5_9BACT|nr:YcaO-like family protein [Candidatus Sungbacteria bacterium]